MYIYTKDLLKLEHTFQRGQSISVDPRLTGIHTPLRLESWRKRLYLHPDREFASYILRGIEKGFYIGVDAAFPRIPAKKNMQSASQHPDVIDKYRRLYKRPLPLPLGSISTYQSIWGYPQKNIKLESGA